MPQTEVVLVAGVAVEAATMRTHHRQDIEAIAALLVTAKAAEEVAEVVEAEVVVVGSADLVDADAEAPRREVLPLPPQHPGRQLQQQHPEKLEYDEEHEMPAFRIKSLR